MPANADTVWSVPVYLPYLQPPLTAEAVAAAEATISHKLPEAYLALLRVQNGGYIRYRLLETVHSKIDGIGPLWLPYDWVDDQNVVDFPLQGLVPFDGDGHWYLCLDYRENPDLPAVTYVDIEWNEQQRVAESFADYLALLEIDVDDELVLEAVDDIEAVKTALGSVLGAPFGPPEPPEWGNGYPVHKARLGSDANPEWAWLTPNSVPRGFVRSTDPRYDELKDLLPDEAARFPELPARSYILDTTDGVRERVLAACAQAGFAVRPLRDYL